MRLTSLLLLLVLLVPVTPAVAADQEYQIINGRPADPGEYPAMAALLIDGFGQFCGGTLVDAEWIMTAAHCFYDSRTGGSSVAPEELQVVMGATDWREGGERLGVDVIAIHPEYEELQTVNDIAMLHLSTPAVSTPAPMADNPGQYTPGGVATVTGWGSTDPYGQTPSFDLLETEVPLVGDGDCGQFYPIVDDRHTCAGDPGTEENPGNDSCQGDSGGPMWLDRGDGVLAVIGITSFGNLCGVEAPGVYTEVIFYLDYVAGIIDGSIDPGAPVDPTTPDRPGGADVEPFHITAGTGISDPVLQAVAISQQLFLDGSAPFGVLATSREFADALGGSSLAYGVAPLLYTDLNGTLTDATLTELRRTVTPGGAIYVLGGPAAVPESIDGQLRSVGFEVIRLAGAGREETAAIVADEIVFQFGDELPLDTVIVATGGNWPDAVTVGQIGSWWGVPVLLTPTDSLNADTADVLARLTPSTVLVTGGTAAVSDGVASQIEQITGVGSTLRLGGDTRFGTAAEITNFNRLLYGETSPNYIVAVNLRREPDAYAHVLAASMVTGALASIFAAVEGSTGESVPAEVLQSICGLDLPIIVAGDSDLISPSAVSQLQEASAGRVC